MKPLPEAVQRAFPCAPDRLRERPWHTDMTSAKAAAYDAAHPLPHPGYRAGQVWATERGHSTVLMTVASDTGWITLPVRGICPVLLDSFAVMYPYLMADPACPHLAPWSPAEGEKP